MSKASQSAARGPLVHLGILAVSVAAAIGVWTRDKEPKAMASGDITVWSGHADAVERVTYESKTHRVALDAKSDKIGRYFVGSTVREAATPMAASDGGAPAPTAPPTTTTLVSVGGADKLATALAPLKALRSLGRIGDDRAAEFGLAEPDGTVMFRVAGTEHKLILGGTTPGGGDRYVKDPASGEVYVLKGEPLRSLESAESSLMERELHEWKEGDVTAAEIVAGGKTRALVRGGAEAKKFWADAAKPDENDETLGNWMSKLDRLRPTEFVAAPPEGREAVVRIDYKGGTRPLGFIEVVKTKAAEAGKFEYFLLTERTRLHAKVSAALGEQLEQDLGSAVK
ncbi:MAG: DUF4340 domain-containing protein [Byssovorax sp.]